MALLLALPGVLAAATAVRNGWQPIADEGTIVTRAHDVWTLRSPPLGQYSLATDRGGPSTHSPGPLLYWVLAVPVRLGPPVLVPLAMALLNTVVLVGASLVAGRRVGRLALYATAFGLLVLVRAWGGYQLYAPWNPSAALLPFVALVVVTWAVTCGAHRLLPGAAFLVSLCVQSHLTFVVPGLWLSALAGTAVAGPLLLDRVRGRPPALDRRDRLRSLGLAGVVGAVCWSLPLLQELRADPGNLGLLLRSVGSGEVTLGARRGANTVIRVLAGPPVWLRAEGTAHTGFLKLDLPVTGAAQATAIGLVGVLGVLTVRAARRGERPLAALGIITGGLLLAGWMVASQIPAQRALILGYSLWWLSAVGIMAWLAVLGGLAREAGLWRASRRDRVPAPASAKGPVGPGRDDGDRPRLGPGRIGAGVTMVALAALVATTLPLDEDLVWAYDPARRLGDAAVAATDPGQRYLLSFGPMHINMAPPVGYRLRAAGAEPVLPQSLGPATGRGYSPRGERCAGVFRLVPVIELTQPDRPRAEVVLLELVIPVPRRPLTTYALTLAPDQRVSC